MGSSGKLSEKLRIHKSGQVSIFVIVAIVLVVAIVLFFVFRGNFIIGDIPAEFLPVYNLYEGCIQEDVSHGAELLGLQGGRIDIGNYEPGSAYSPFSSHLNFFGNPVGYWYYLSGNGIIKENAPSKGDMEGELEGYVEENLELCDFKQYYEQGFYVEYEEPEVDVSIREDRILVNVNSDLVVSRGGDSARRSNHEIEVRSNLGKLYETAREVYNAEIEEAFLEMYSGDVLRLYAPVDGVEISCSPEIWQTREVVSSLKQGLKDNLAYLRFKGDYYDSDKEYFVVDRDVDVPVRFLYSEDWPSRIEIYGDNVDQELIIAEPVGNQEGLGVMGFCYVPYHYVYDVAFPVMVQVGDGLELFQFPITVVIDNNVPRSAILPEVEYLDNGFDVCDNSFGEVEVYTYDVNLNALPADISFKCLDSVCDLGKTEVEGDLAVLRTSIPQCSNGYLVGEAEGYVASRVLFSSNSESIADIVLDREYDVSVEVISGIGERAIVYFRGQDSRTAVLPDNPIVKLREGSYDLEVYVYGDSGITIPASKRTECVDVSRSGILGLFGATREECFDVEIPETNVESALLGGGKTSTYILESDLQQGKVSLYVDSLEVPGSLAELQTNYEIFETQGVDIVFG